MGEQYNNINKSQQYIKKIHKAHNHNKKNFYQYWIKESKGKDRER